MAIFCFCFLKKKTLNISTYQAISNQTLAKFEKFCNERIKPVIFAQMAIEEDFGTPEEITVVADPDAEAKDPTPSNSHSTAAEAILLDEDSSSKKEDHSGFQVFFQPKASSSNLSTELKMEIDRKFNLLFNRS